MQNFVKIKLSRNGEITLLFTCPVTNFDVANMSFYACISEFTVACVVTEVFI